MSLIPAYMWMVKGRFLAVVVWSAFRVSAPLNWGHAQTGEEKRGTATVRSEWLWMNHRKRKRRGGYGEIVPWWQRKWRGTESQRDGTNWKWVSGLLSLSCMPSLYQAHTLLQDWKQYYHTTTVNKPLLTRNFVTACGTFSRNKGITVSLWRHSGYSFDSCTFIPLCVNLWTYPSRPCWKTSLKKLKMADGFQLVCDGHSRSFACFNDHQGQSLFFW